MHMPNCAQQMKNFVVIKSDMIEIVTRTNFLWVHLNELSRSDFTKIIFTE